MKKPKGRTLRVEKLPTLRILPLRIAMESANGKVVSLVKIVPFLTNKSAATLTGGIRDVRVDQSAKINRVDDFHHQVKMSQNNLINGEKRKLKTEDGRI